MLSILICSLLRIWICICLRLVDWACESIMKTVVVNGNWTCICSLCLPSIVSRSTSSSWPISHSPKMSLRWNIKYISMLMHLSGMRRSIDWLLWWNVSFQLTLECPWLSQSPSHITLPLHISAPFAVHYKLHTSHSRKFVNIHVQGKTSTVFINQLTFFLFIYSFIVSELNYRFNAKESNVSVPELFHETAWSNLYKSFTRETGVEKSQ